MKKNKTLFIIAGSFIFAFSFYYLMWSFSPGSYSRAEIYEFAIPEKDLIDIIKDIKIENEEIDLKLYGYEDGKNKLWSTFYFYYNDKDKIIHTWTRPKDKNPTNFAFVGYKSGKGLGNWISANEYFLWWKNEPAKKEFEKRILNKIIKKVKNESPTKN